MKKQSMILINTTLVGIILCFSQIVAQVVINEIMPSNVNTFSGENNDFPDWIELKNIGSETVNLNDYYLSDDPNNLTKWQFKGSAAIAITPNSYLILSADGTGMGSLNTNFKLSQSGETLTLTRPDGQTIGDQVAFGEISGDISWARYLDGSGNFQYCLEPTPGTTNREGYQQRTLPPSVSQTAGFYTAPISVVLSHYDPAAIIYYTVDGTTPNKNATRYTIPIQLAETATLKARVLSDNSLFSAVSTNTYFIHVESDLPVLSITTDPDGLYHEETGIYANPDSTGQTWEKRISLEYFEDAQRQFNIDAGMRIQGNSSVFMPKKSFRLFFRSGYGEAKLNYPLFPNNPIQSFDNLVLRSGYDEDISTDHGTLLRDPLITELWDRNNSLVSHSRFALVYLNGYYFGIYDMREKVNDTFAKDHMGYQDLDWIRLRYGFWELEKGSDQAWNDLLDFFSENSFESDEMINKAKSLIDIDNFLWLHAFAHFSQYRSWYYGASAFRENISDAKWIFTIWDMDRSYTDLAWNGFDYYNTTTGVFYLNIIIGKMLENESFKAEFINRMMDLKNTTFRPDYVISILDSLKSEIDFAIPMETNRWGNSYEKWLTNIKSVDRFIRNRPYLVFKQMQNYFNLDTTHTVSIQSEVIGTSFKINSIEISNFSWQGDYFVDVPITVTVYPPEGYEFNNWEDSRIPNQPSVTINPQENLRFVPRFKKVGIQDKSDSMPANFHVDTNYPNPFNPETTIPFHLPTSAKIKLTIFDINGSLVHEQAVNNLFSPGKHSIKWNAATHPSGVYFYHLTAIATTGARWKQTKKMLLLR